jgi:hypothetical protein
MILAPRVNCLLASSKPYEAKIDEKDLFTHFGVNEGLSWRFPHLLIDQFASS